jgi:hypothetical protein
MPTKVGVLTDSHGQWARTTRAVEALQARGATVFIHCGDIESDRVLDALAGLDAHVVWGNCDGMFADGLARYAAHLGIGVHDESGEVTVDGKRLAFTHGHLHTAVPEAVRAGADFAVRGHDHVRRSERRGATTVIWAGALHKPRDQHGTGALLLEPATGAFEWIDVP